MKTYDELFLDEMYKRYPEEPQFEIPAGVAIMSTPWLCGFCGEDLWYAIMPDHSEIGCGLYQIQELGFFGEPPGDISVHDNNRCHDRRLSTEAHKAYEAWINRE